MRHLEFNFYDTNFHSASLKNDGFISCARKVSKITNPTSWGTCNKQNFNSSWLIIQISGASVHIFIFSSRTDFSSEQISVQNRSIQHRLTFICNCLRWLEIVFWGAWSDLAQIVLYFENIWLRKIRLPRKQRLWHKNLAKISNKLSRL